MVLQANSSCIESIHVTENVTIGLFTNKAVVREGSEGTERLHCQSSVHRTKPTGSEGNGAWEGIIKNVYIQCTC